MEVFRADPSWKKKRSKIYTCFSPSNTNCVIGTCVTDRHRLQIKTEGAINRCPAKRADNVDHALLRIVVSHMHHFQWNHLEVCFKENI